jgi:membrane protein implicated in regulation of membrane protease activity
MNWWGWVIGGAMLLGAELSLVNAQFYLVIIGASALAVGLISLLSPAFPDWAQWATFTVLALGLMLGIRARLYGWLHRESPTPLAGRREGSVFTLPNALAPGASCQAEQGGSFWTVLNDSAGQITAGTRVRIARVQGLTLLVRPE